MEANKRGSYLHHLQIGQPLLHQLLYLPLLGLMLVLSERIDGASSCVLSEVVSGELVCLTEERPELYSSSLLVSNMHLEAHSCYNRTATGNVRVIAPERQSCCSLTVQTC